MRKRLLPILLTVVIVIGVLAGCGGDKGTSGSGGKKVTLSMWYWNRSVEDKLIEDVSKEYPNITIKAEKIGGDYLAKLTTTMAAGSGLPDIVCFNDWVADIVENSDKFVNLYEPPCDAESIKDQYYEWKWNMAQSGDGKTLIALPMDTGPCALFYRTDLFEKAGLPTDPEELSKKLQTWDDYIEAGKVLQSKTDAKMFDNLSRIFNLALLQNEMVLLDKDNKFIGDQQHVKDAFDLAVRINKEGLSANIDSWSPEWNAAMNTGKVASFDGAVWMKKILEEAAPDTSGKWRVTDMPGGPANNGGSFIGISKSSKHVEEAWTAIKWMMNPENQARQQKSMDLFASTPKVFEDESIFEKEVFFGDQEADRVFAKSSEKMPIFYYGPKTGTMIGAYTEELKLVADQNKDPEQAWKDAVEKAKKELER